MSRQIKNPRIMKKLVLLFTGMLMGLTTVTGTETLSNTQLLDDNLSKNKRYHHAQPIMFVERGIEFIIFPNGDFDFNTATDSYGYNDYGDDMYYRKTNTNTRRGSVTRTVSSPGTTSRYYDYGPRGVQVVHDRYGNVRRIGNVFISYDYYGRVKRLGSVYVRYNRGLLKQVGGLHLKYNKHGKFIKSYGHVNRNYNHNWNHNNFGWDNNYGWNNDNDNYYYKKNGKTVKKSKKIKRKQRDDD